MKPDIHIVHLYPDLLCTYGDRGNVLALRRRAEWRGFEVRVSSVTRGHRLPRAADLIFIGGGSDRIQQVIAQDLAHELPRIEDAVASGGVLFGVCAGYQMLGRLYVSAAGDEIPGLGLLDVWTERGRGRIVGNVVADARIGARRFSLVGFTNHGGRTRLGASATPLARVLRGGGNNEGDRGEGAVQGKIVGTYLHGPILPSNPHLADALLEASLERHLQGEPLVPLDDSLEAGARERGLRRRGKRARSRAHALHRLAPRRE